MLDFFKTDFALLVSVLLAIISIVFIFVRYRSKDSNVASVHIWYIAGILIFIIIELITYVCMNNDYSSDIIKVVSFGATLASIILSVLAIFITVTSSNSIIRVKDSLDHLSKNVPETINDSIMKITNASESMSQSFNEILSAQESNTKEIRGLLSRFGDIMKEELARQTDRLDKIQDVFSETHKPIQAENTENIIPNEILHSFVRSTSLLSIKLIILINMIINKRINHAFDLETLSVILGEEDNKSGAWWYLYACLVLFSSLGLIKYQIINEGTSFVFSEINGTLAKAAEGQLKNSPDYDSFILNIDRSLKKYENNGEIDNNNDLE